MKVIIDESVFQFLKENRIELSQQLKKVINHLKVHPKMYEKIIDDDNIRHFVIKGIDFGYMIDDEIIIISDCRFVKSKTRLKVR